MHGEVRRWLAGQIARRQARGESCRAIGRTLGIARNTVRTLIAEIAEETLRLATGASAQDRAAKPPRVPRRSKLDRFQARIDFWLETHKGLTAVRLHELLREEGFQGGRTIVRDRLIRPMYNNRDLESDLTFQTAVADLYRCMVRGKSYCAALTALSQGNVRNKPFALDQAERKAVVDAGRRGHYSQWRAGVAVEMSALGIGSRAISHVLSMSRTTLRKATAAHHANGLSTSKKRNPKEPRRPIGSKAKRILEILHQKPLAFNINRSNWNRPSLAQAYESTHGQRIGLSTVGDLLKRSGYTIKKAKRCLTSPDPCYREKVELLLHTLQNLEPGDLFFFVDELGPLRVKKHGGRTIVRKDELPRIPKIQPDKGSLTMAAALSATANQVTWLYTPAKDSRAMVTLIELLFNQHMSAKRLYITWDCASWHDSVLLVEWLDELNAETQRVGFGPVVHLIPLPTSAQFLDVLEAVFSGMKRAVVHHSNYDSINAMKGAISRHFSKGMNTSATIRSELGKKIWQLDFFNDMNSLRAGDYREW